MPACCVDGCSHRPPWNLFACTQMWRCFFTCAVVVFATRSIMRACEPGGCGFSAKGGIIYEIKGGQARQMAFWPPVVGSTQLGHQSGCLAASCSGSIGSLHRHQRPTKHALLTALCPEQELFYFYELAPLVLVGIIGGLAAAAFIRCNDWISRWVRSQPIGFESDHASKLRVFHRWRASELVPQGPRARLRECLQAAAIISTVSFVLPLLRGCTPCPKDAMAACRAEDSQFVRMRCPPGSYNDLATLMFNTQDDAIRMLFEANTDPGDRVFGYGSLLIFFAAYMAAFAWTYGMGEGRPCRCDARLCVDDTPRGSTVAA